MTIPLFIQAQNGKPKFKYFIRISRSLGDSKSEVSEAPEIPDKTFPENENGVHDVLAHHFDSILILHHLFRFSKGTHDYFPILLLIHAFLKSAVIKMELVD